MPVWNNWWQAIYTLKKEVLVGLVIAEILNK